MLESIAQLKTYVARFFFALQSGRFPELEQYKNHTVKTYLSAGYCCDNLHALAKRNADFICLPIAPKLLDGKYRDLGLSEITFEIPRQANPEFRESQCLKHLIGTITRLSQYKSLSVHAESLMLRFHEYVRTPSLVTALSRQRLTSKEIEKCLSSVSIVPPKSFDCAQLQPTMVYFNFNRLATESEIIEAFKELGIYPHQYVLDCESIFGSGSAQLFANFDSMETTNKVLENGIVLDRKRCYPEQLVYMEQVWKDFIVTMSNKGKAVDEEQENTAVVNNVNNMGKRSAKNRQM